MICVASCFERGLDDNFRLFIGLNRTLVLFDRLEANEVSGAFTIAQRWTIGQK